MGRLDYWSGRDLALLEPLETAMVNYFDNSLGTAASLAKQMQGQAWAYCRSKALPCNPRHKPPRALGA